MKNIKRNLIVLWGSILGFMPALALASRHPDCGGNIRAVSNIEEVLCKLQQIFSAIIPFLIALAIIYFIWGVVMYVVSDDEEAKSKGKDRIVYGIIGLAVIISVWGLVNILLNTFFGSNTGGGSFAPPSLPGI
jgi:hypothetical protein